MNKAAKLVSGAILNLDGKIVFIGGKRYVIPPPTIHRITGAAYYLSEVGGGETLKDLFRSINEFENLAKALSWFIAGNASLSKKLSRGTVDEIINALDVAYSMISAQSFMKLSALAKSVASLTAKQRL